MALTLGDNFSYQGAKPLDARLKYDTLAAMKAVVDATMYDGCMAYCSATDKTYQWKSTNTVDESTGKWREFSSGGGGGSTYTAGDGIDITNDVISTKQSEEGDIDEIVDVYPQAGNLVSIVNAFNKGDIYSTDEKMIGQWTDGKPLYQKTVSVTGFSGTSGNRSIEFLDVPYGKVVSMRAFLYEENGYESCSPLNMYSENSGNFYYRCFTYNDGTTHKGIIALYWKDIQQDSTKFTFYFTVQYTKQSDTAISIGEETEYSTDEKVVGTWIDGSPVYQKTIQVRPTKNYPDSGYVTDTIYTDSNVDYMILMTGTIQFTYGNYTQRPLPYTLRTDSSHQYSAVPKWDSGNLIMEMYVEGSSYAPSDILFTITLQYTKTTT